ncbi:unnamed protein product [Protopolystoma xenopodis]|uniref:Uncharacterized protein n=1 Tax=Protopolystoma xenopodis TaxID=117903 RepID=A0A3S5CGK0_9PLAT|nr:unnamed protein product [Protopolystoma xenopodis]
MVGSAEAVLGLPNSSMYYAVGLSVGGGITPDAGLVTLASGRWEDGAAGVGPEKYRPVMACTGLHDQTDAEPTRRMGCMLREEGMGSGCRDPNEWTVRDTVEDGQQADKSLLPTSTQARRCHLYYDVRNATASEVSVDQMLPYASSPRWRPRSPDLTTAPASLMMLPRSKSQLIATSSRPTFNVEIFPRDANLQLSQQEPHIKEDSSFGLLQTKVLGRPGIVAFRPIDLEIGSEGNDLELDGEEDDNQVYDPANAGVAIDNTNKLDTNSRSLLLLTQLPGQTPLQSEVYRLPGEKPLITQKGFEFQTDDTTSSTNVTSSSIIRSGNPPEERHKPTKYVQAAYREASFV